MRIEEHWEDGFLYYVEFQVKQENLLRTIKKHIVLYEELSKVEIMNIVKKRFGNVQFVRAVEFHDDILLIKK
ncbi:hypothetical protein [Carnobacterium maltaromaticum]|uniref:hypothetical protein n=1 Tax=Carnobacterium maltaromaticum TaxID=2751 RepID=UPI00295EDD52|nr:hypothetical protein [Carnobacterium maltaromaticum]